MEKEQILNEAIKQIENFTIELNKLKHDLVKNQHYESAAPLKDVTDQCTKTLDDLNKLKSRLIK